MNQRNPLVLYLAAALLLLVVLTSACALLPQGLALTALSDLIDA